MIAAIDRDPWGLPYKIVMGKLRRSNPTLSETLDKVNFDRLLNSLFPGNSVETDRTAPPPLLSTLVEAPAKEHIVDTSEMIRLIMKRPSRKL